VTYAGLVIANSFGFLVIVGAGSRNYFISKRSALFGGLVFTILLVLMTAGLTANLEVANASEMPTLLLADQIHPALRILMTIIMVGVMFNSVIGVLYPFVTRFTEPYSGKYRIMLAIALILAFVFSYVGFVDLVNFFYPVFGYIECSSPWHCSSVGYSINFPGNSCYKNCFEGKKKMEFIKTLFRQEIGIAFFSWQCVFLLLRRFRRHLQHWDGCRLFGTSPFPPESAD